jgi:hypothetical protein
MDANEDTRFQRWLRHENNSCHTVGYGEGDSHCRVKGDEVKIVCSKSDNPIG